MRLATDPWSWTASRRFMSNQDQGSAPRKTAGKRRCDLDLILLFHIYRRETATRQYLSEVSFELNRINTI